MNSIFLRVAAILVVAIAFTVSAFSQTGRVDAVSAQASSVTEFDVNGLKVILKRRAAAPTVAAALFIRGGAQNLTEKTAGIERFMLNAAAEGGKLYPKQSLRRELASSGSVISAGSNEDFSVLSLVSTRQSFERLWAVYSDLITDPAFATADVERIRAQLISGIQDNSDTPDGALSELSDRVVFQGHPYAVDTSGTAATMSSFTVDELKNYHRQVMQTSQLLLVVVGDVDADLLKKLATNTFGKLPKGTYVPKPVPPLVFSKPTLDTESRVIDTNYVQGVFSAPTLNTKDYYAMRVAISILAGRLFEEVRVKRQLSYAPDATLRNDIANSATVYVSAVRANEAVKVMRDEVHKLQTEPVGLDELSNTVGLFLTQYYLGQETNSAQALSLAQSELMGNGWRNSFEFLNKVREVRSEDVRAVANKYMKNIRFVAVGNPDSFNRNVFLSDN